MSDPAVTLGYLRTSAGWIGRLSRAASSLLKAKTHTLFGHLPGALSGDEEAVHQLRVESRRLRVALSLVSEKPDGRRTKRVRELLQQLTRTAGVSRDLDVLLGIYDQRLGELPGRTAEQSALRRRLADARCRGQRNMVDALLDLDVSQLRSRLRKLVARDVPPLSVINERFQAFAVREGQALTEGLAHVGAQLDPVALHNLRRRARRLRYALEVARAIIDENTGATKPWKVVQDLIGGIHDHHVLAEWLECQAAAGRKRGREALAAVAVTEAAWARERMARLHDHFIASRPHAIVEQGLSFLRPADRR